MNRRDLARLGLGIGFLPVSAGPTLSAEDLKPAPQPPAAPSIIMRNSPRTYNQVNMPRRYVAGQRRFSIYWAWSYPWESNRDLTGLDNRFSTVVIDLAIDRAVQILPAAVHPDIRLVHVPTPAYFAL